MTVCGNRTDEPGFFTACTSATSCRRCVCADQVKAEQKQQQQSDTHLDTQENR